MLKERLRQILIEQAQTGNPTTYRELASRLGLEPPNTIHRIAEVLESLMQDDVAAGRPILSTICVSRMQTGIPARGFFLEAQALGILSGDPMGPRHVPSTHASCSVYFHSTKPRAGISPRASRHLA